MANSWLIETIGKLTLFAVGAKCAYRFASLMYLTFLGRLFGHGINVRDCGPWAVVTGATDGIGKAYAKQLAAEGLNVVLISRTPAKLKAVADEIKSHCASIQVKTIAVDFTHSEAIYKTVKSELSKLQIGLLVNNVGTAVGGGFRLSDFEDEKHVNDNINCNIMSMARMCHMVLPEMIRRKKGVIINIGSVTGTAPTPLLTLYGATKAFVDKFSQDLAAEVKPFGVTVQTVHPGCFVATNMASHIKPSLMNPDADKYVAATIRTLGLESRTAGYWAHRIQICDMTNYYLPRSFLESQVYNFMEKEAEKLYGPSRKSS